MRKTKIDLVPDVPNPTPDYYCTWQTQLYATSDGKPSGQRAVIGEKALFGTEKPFGWTDFYPDARRDLLLVMDDSWDVAVPANPGDDDPKTNPGYGSLVPDPGKFPTFTAGSASPEQALAKLSEAVRAKGWKGLGGWVCAQESAPLLGNRTPEEYWRERLEWSEHAGFAYWKVDWGKRCGDTEFRRMLSRLAHKAAPHVTVENAMKTEVIPDSDVFRSYDVPAILSVPMTMAKLAKLVDTDAPRDGFLGLVNCEDEAYAAAAGGFAMGIMRHPFAGTLPDGRADMSFPAVHRDLKTKISELTRAARFHRIAPAFGCGRGEAAVSAAILTDSWTLEKPYEEFEAWWYRNPAFPSSEPGSALTACAPAAIARRMKLPVVTPDDAGGIPFVICARNPNGVVSIAALGRTLGRKWYTPRCGITIDAEGADTLGAFGHFGSLTLTGVRPGRILMQDLAGDCAYDVTDECVRTDGALVIGGALIDRIGTETQPAGDTSEPGIVIAIR